MEVSKLAGFGVFFGASHCGRFHEFLDNNICVYYYNLWNDALRGPLCMRELHLLEKDLF